MNPEHFPELARLREIQRSIPKDPPKDARTSESGHPWGDDEPRSIGQPVR